MFAIYQNYAGLEKDVNIIDENDETPPQPKADYPTQENFG